MDKLARPLMEVKDTKTGECQNRELFLFLFS